MRPRPAPAPPPFARSEVTDAAVGSGSLPDWNSQAGKSRAQSLT